MGEPDPQRTVDGWVDQVVDLLRAVDEVAAQHRATLARGHGRAVGDHAARAATSADRHLAEQR